MTAAYTQLIPYKELGPGQAAAIRNEIVKYMIAQAVTQLRKSPDDFVVRDIRADLDLDFTYEDWRETTSATADAYETMSTGTMADQRWMGIFGVKNCLDTLACTALKFNIGGADRAIWQLQALNEDDGWVGFTPFGIVIPQNTPYIISRFVRSASASVCLVLKGLVVEPRGKVISP